MIFTQGLKDLLLGMFYTSNKDGESREEKNELIELQDLSDIIIPSSHVMFPEDKEIWNVQLFRSIDGGAAFGFPDKPEEAAKVGLVSGNDHFIDRSAQDAYIQAIRRAKKYFLGSSFAWKADGIRREEINALHLFLKELSLKIVSKIESDKDTTTTVLVIGSSYTTTIFEITQIEDVIETTVHKNLIDETFASVPEKEVLIESRNFR